MNGFQQAIRDHEEWKTAFERAIRNGGPAPAVDAIRGDGACSLGAWLSGNGKDDVLNPTALAMLRDVHLEFHQAAGEVLVLAQAGRSREAAHALAEDGKYAQWSGTLLAALKRYAGAAAAVERASRLRRTGPAA